MDFHLGEWLVEPSLNQISRPGGSIRLEPMVMELLLLLARRPNEIATKEEIAEHLWPGTFVTESSIFRHVSELRRALGDDPRHPRYVQTISKKGYRLVGEISSVQRADTPSSGSIPWAAAALLTFLAVLAFVLYWLGRTESRPQIAVLPFRELSGEAGTRFTAGMEAMIRNKLALLDGLDVIRAEDESRARELGAQAMLEGAVGLVEGTIHITAELSDSSTGERFWSEGFQGRVEDVLSLHSEIAISVAGAVDAEISARDERRLERRRGPVTAAAYDAYLRGELFENRVDCASFERAVESYSEAMNRDRRFVEVYPRLFDALVASAVLGCLPPAPLFSELQSLLELARRNGLDDDRQAQGAGALALWRDGDAAAALAAFREADENGSSSDEEDLSYAVTLVASGFPEDGVREARRCLEALPIDLGENWAMGGVLYLAGHYDEAIDQLLQTLELYPDYRPALQLLALSYWMAGDTERALATAVRSEPSKGERFNRFDAVPGYIYALAGDVGRARQILAEWTARSETDWVPKTSLALLHTGLGEHEEALRWLREARREQDPWVVLVDADPAFRSLRARGEISLRIP